MKKKFSLILILLLTSITIKSFAQKVSDILSKGVEVKEKERIFLIRNGTNFQFDKSEGTAGNYQQYEDSCIFLIHNKSGVNVFLQPLNPLKYSYDSKTTFIPDPINADADKAFSSITSLLAKVSGGTGTAPGAPAKENEKNKKEKKGLSKAPSTCDLTYIVADLNDINQAFGNDPKNSINTTFTKLRDSIDFANEQNTNNAIKSVSDAISIYKKYFSDLNGKIKNLEDDIGKINCTAGDSLISKYVLIEILNDVKTSYSTKNTRLKNLQNAYQLVKDAADKVNFPTQSGIQWFGESINVKVDNNKISILTITINNSGFELKNDEIVKSSSTVSFKKVLRFRRFHHFIPEVSAGIAYTWLSFPKYGVTTDASGKNIVSSAGSDDFKKLNLTAMINFVHYTDDPVTWFWQLGVGAKSDYPTLLTGFGGRFDISGKTLALSVGAASTWVKSLTKLHIGDQVSGASAVENDLTYQFKLPKFYVGVQYNF